MDNKELPTTFFSKISVKEKGVIKHQAKIDCSFGKDIYLTIITDNCALDATNNNYYYIKRLLLFHKGQYAVFVSVCSDQAIYERFLTKNTLFNHYFNLEKLLDIIV